MLALLSGKLLKMISPSCLHQPMPLTCQVFQLSLLSRMGALRQRIKQTLRVNLVKVCLTASFVKKTVTIHSLKLSMPGVVKKRNLQMSQVKKVSDLPVKLQSLKQERISLPILTRTTKNSTWMPIRLLTRLEVPTQIRRLPTLNLDLKSLAGTVSNFTQGIRL